MKTADYMAIESRLNNILLRHYCADGGMVSYEVVRMRAPEAHPLSTIDGWMSRIHHVEAR